MIFAMPPLTVATALLALDRYLGFHFFTNDLGGNMMNYANLFWLFGHPEVYILILPAFGVYSEVVSTFSSKELYGYTSLVCATAAIALLSFTVWVHHFFTMGQNANINAAFGIATMTIGVPTGVKIYDWIWTMFRGRGAVHRADALFARLHDDVRARRPDRDNSRHSAARLLGSQHAVSGCAFPQHADPGPALRDARRLSLLVPQGVRLPARRETGAASPSAAGWSASTSPSCRSMSWVRPGMARRTQEVFEPAFRPWLYVAGVGALVLLCALGVPVRPAVGQHSRARRQPRVCRRSLGRARARMVGLRAAAGIQFRGRSRASTAATRSTSAKRKGRSLSAARRPIRTSSFPKTAWPAR